MSAGPTAPELLAKALREQRAESPFVDVVHEELAKRCADLDANLSATKKVIAELFDILGAQPDESNILDVARRVVAERGEDTKPTKWDELRG